MYVNKCVKCGREFETKNPKRVICPDCLYPDKKMMINPSPYDGGEQAAPQPQNDGEQQNLRSYSTEDRPQFYNSYSSGGNDNQGYRRPPQRNQRPQQGGYNNRFNNRRPQGNNRFNNRRPGGKPKAPKQLLVSKDQLEQIELLYKSMLPLPNPDAHEVIGEKIGLEPRKVFFGINLVRQKLMLPKLPFPKRKLAISPDQLFAIKNLYEPLLPLPPIGCHKIIAAQLKMDEWRVHVGIGLIRSQMGLQRWNQDRTDIPEEFKKKMEEHQAAAEAKAAAKAAEKAAKKAAAEEAAMAAETDAEVSQPAETGETTGEEKPKRGRKPKKVEESAES